MNELNECTFKPKTNPGIADNNEGVVVVKGLGRHLELQELKKKQRISWKIRKCAASFSILDEISSFLTSR